MPDRTRLVPVVAVVSETTLTGLASTVEATRNHINEHPEWADLCQRNGWTAEALAYGALLNAVAEEADDERPASLVVASLAPRTPGGTPWVSR